MSSARGASSQGEAGGRQRVAVVGAAGRMGTRLLRMLDAHPRLILGAALERGEATSSLGSCRVVVDFSAPAACAVLAPLVAAQGLPYVVGSTGLTAVEHAALDEAARRCAVLQAANLSLGVNVMLDLVARASQRLADFDIEIAEVHHRHKKDAPSGTALALGAAASRGRPALAAVPARQGTAGASRGANELGFSALRGGDVAGEHTVFFFGEGERLELTHRAATPDIFARGALVAAEWLLGRPPGRYQMTDVLGLGP